MKTYFSDLIPKIQRYSKKLDNHSLLTGHHWVVIDETIDSKTVYIFRPNGELLISNNGKVEKAKWEDIGNETLLIDRSTESLLLKQGFIDDSVLILKVDGKKEYAFLINEKKFNDLNSMQKVLLFLNENYIERDPRIGEKNIISRSSKFIKGEFQEYRIINEFVGWSFSTGKYIEYEVEFSDLRKAKVLFSSAKQKYCYTTFDSVKYFDDLGTCIVMYKFFLDKGV